MKRRSFLKGILSSVLAVMTGAASWIGCLVPGRRFELSADERTTLSAACARIIPSDDSPGASEANVAEYIERALATRYHRVLREPFREGLSILNGLSARSWGKSFAHLNDEDQDSVLAYVESGKADRPDFPASRFFRRLIILTLEGFLGDPSHGGNRDETGWKFIGYKPGEPRPVACQKDCRH